MGYWKKRGLRGSYLEEIINRTNEEYFKDELAVVQKLPTSIKPVELDQNKGTITLAYFESKSTVDYMGNVQGIPICFDAKETSKVSLPISNIHPHQIEFMEKFHLQGGLSFIIVSFTKEEKYFLLDFETLKTYWDNANNNGIKSINIKNFNPKLELFSKEGYLLHYLEGINTYLKIKDKNSGK